MTTTKRQTVTGDRETALTALVTARYESAPAAQLLRQARNSLFWQIRVTGPRHDDVTVTWHGNGAYTVSWGTRLSPQEGPRPA